MANEFYNDLTDKDLMRRVLRNEHEAFSVLVNRHTPMFYAAAYRICSDQNDAEDIVQDAFLKLWKNPAIWKETRGAKFTTWFYRIVTNQAIDHIRKKKSSGSGDAIERIEDSAISQHSQMEMDERQVMLEKAIQSLPERQKLAINMCFYEGLSNKDAASILDVSVKALESLVMRAKAGLADEFLRLGLVGCNKSEGNGNG